jgi:glutathionyl-hydroquinone reductase
MGSLVDGQWYKEGYDPDKGDGQYLNEPFQFTDKILPKQEDSSAKYEAEAGRYHLYISLGCPWSHLTLLYWRLKNLQNIVSYSVVEPRVTEYGWEFSYIGKNAYHCQGAQADPLFGYKYLYQVYQRANSTYSGQVTVPLLWDKYNNTLVNNNAFDITRIFNSAFDQLAGNQVNFFPTILATEIDDMAAWLIKSIFHGVYLCGFATSQLAYDHAVSELFTRIEEVEHRLSHERYLLGDAITALDWLIFPILIRFEPIFFGLFRTNKQHLSHYPNLHDYLHELYQLKGVAETVDFEHIKQHYYFSYPELYPHRIIPAGFIPNYTTQHRRGF